MSRSVSIGGRLVGTGQPTYVIAEMSANHGQRYEGAEALVLAAAESGADAVKLQTYTPDTLTLDAEGEAFRIRGGLWDGRHLHDLYGEAYMPWHWQPRLAEVAQEVGIHLFSSAFDPTAVAFLERMEVPAHKLASFELVDLPLIRTMAATGKPLIVSTGMGTLEEIEEAVRTAREAGAREIVLLQCNSAYPAPPEEMHLRTLADLADTFDVPVGLSDHTLGIAVPVAAVSLGASVIEKHFTLCRDIPTADAAFSLEPDELREMVEAIRVAERALGEVRYGAKETDQASLRYRRSLFVVKEMQPGEEFTADHLRSIRPAAGLHTRHLTEVLGRRATRRIARGTPLSWDLVE